MVFYIFLKKSLNFKFFYGLHSSLFETLFPKSLFFDINEKNDRTFETSQIFLIFLEERLNYFEDMKAKTP